MPPVVVSRLIASTTEALEERKARQQQRKAAEKGLTRALGLLGLSGPHKPAASSTCPPALWEYGTCVNILQHLAQEEQGLSLSSWLKFSRVCKTWRTAMQVSRPVLGEAVLQCSYFLTATRLRCPTWLATAGGASGPELPKEAHKEAD